MVLTEDKWLHDAFNGILMAFNGGYNRHFNRQLIAINGGHVTIRGVRHTEHGDKTHAPRTEDDAVRGAEKAQVIVR